MNFNSGLNLTKQIKGKLNKIEFCLPISLLNKLCSRGNPAAEGTGYFFINKISNFQSFIVLRWKKCVKLANKVIIVINRVSTIYLWKKNEEKRPILSVFSENRLDQILGTKLNYSFFRSSAFLLFLPFVHFLGHLVFYLFGHLDSVYLF